jgi:hypothetical protein
MGCVKKRKGKGMMKVKIEQVMTIHSSKLNFFRKYFLRV